MRSILVTLVVIIAGGWMACSASAAQPVTMGGGIHASGWNATKHFTAQPIANARQPRSYAHSIISPDRIHFQRWDMGQHMGDWGDHWMNYRGPRLWPSALGMFFGFLFTLAFLIAIAATLLQVVPTRVEELRAQIIQAPFSALALGVLGLGALIGLVPISAITIIGIPLIPIVVLAIVLFWVAGYLLGVYVIALRIADAFREIPHTLTNRLAIVAIGLAVFAFLNFVPFVGWLINLAAAFFGMGGIAKALFDRWQTRFITRSQPPPPTPQDDIPVI